MKKFITKLHNVIKAVIKENFYYDEDIDEDYSIKVWSIFGMDFVIRGNFIPDDPCFDIKLSNVRKIAMKILKEEKQPVYSTDWRDDKFHHFFKIIETAIFRKETQMLDEENAQYEKEYEEYCRKEEMELLAV
jgi:hypothetical protein